jgi:hypothetical protein
MIPNLIPNFTTAALAIGRAAEESTRSRFTLSDAPPLWVIFLLLGPALFIVVAAVYGLERGAPRTAVLRLAIFRFLALAALLTILFRPAIETFRVRSQRTVLPILIDDSASMRRADAYTNDGERKALAKAAGLADGDSPAAHSRAELAARALTNKLLPTLNDRGYEVRLYRFSDDVSAISSPNEVEGRGDRTKIGDAIVRVLEESRGRMSPGLVLISDGRNNDGRDPREAARQAAADLIPIYTVGVGDPSAPTNLAIEIVEMPEVALENDEVSITARVSGIGVEGVVVPVTVAVEDAEGSEVETLALVEANISASQGPTRVVLRFTPKQAGDMRIAVKVAPRPDEALTDDNVVRRTLKVKPEKIRVLYLEGAPRWEYRYLKNALARADKSIVYHSFLTSAGQGFPQECTKGERPLTEIPNDRQQLLENYDVIIFGDVPPDKLGATREDRDRFMESVREFVRRGGGFLMIAGEYDSPRSYAGTPIQELLPIELATQEEESLLPREQKEEFRPRLENPTQPNEIVRLIDDPEKNRELWEDPNSLRGQFWFCPVKKAKPGAEVLLRHPDLRNRYGNLVLAATTFFPEGRTMFLGIDSTWRWRYAYGDRFFDKFWRRAIRTLALNRLKTGDRRYNLNVERSVFALNDRAVLEARILDESFQPSRKPNQPAFVSSMKSGKVTPIVLDAVPGEPGTFRAAFVVNEEGSYHAWITADDSQSGKRVASVEFTAQLPDRENRDPMLDAATLKAIAAISAGTQENRDGDSWRTDHYVPLSRIEEVARRFKDSGRIDIPEAPEVTDLWDRSAVLVVLVAILAAEWWLRKQSQLL